MNVTMTDIKKLREMTGAGLADCKKALAEADDLEGAIEIIRKKGQAVAAKRSDREAAEGCVLVKVADGYGCIVALKCETDFVAKNADFVALAQQIIDLACANKVKSLDALKALPMGESTVADAVVARSGVTGEKMELDGFSYIEAPAISTYNHQNKNMLCTMVALNKQVEDELVGKNIAMQIASAAPLAINEDAIAQEVKDTEYRVAVEKTKEEQAQRAIDNALKKAGINPAHVDSEDHMESNMAKGWITAEDVAKAKEIIATVGEQAKANLKEQMVNNIAKGRLNKFLKENCLIDQEYIWDKAMTVAQYLKSVDKELTVVDFKRFTLRAE